MAKISNNKFEAVREFTDRKEPKKAFEDEYMIAKDNPKKYYLLSYYGMGGIGKTRLIQQLIKEKFCNEDSKNIEKYYVKYDFEQSTDMRHCLAALRNMLINLDNRKFKFLRFDLLCLKYAELTGMNMSLSDNGKNIIESNPIIKSVLEIVGALPVVSYFADFVIGINGLSKVGNEISNKSIANEVNETIKGMSDDEMLDKMLEYFGEDLQECTEKLNEPLVIFLDTYERIIKDDWLKKPRKGLISRIPHVLWVITGRDKLDFDWDGLRFETLGMGQSLDNVNNPDIYIDSKLHLLGHLSKEDTIKFLNTAEVPQEYHNDIFSLTDGNPLWLDVTVGLSELARNNGNETFEIIGIKSTEELAERYVKYMDINMQDMVKKLAILGKWTKGVLDILKPYNSTLYMNIVKKCNINETSEGNFHMHNLVRDAIWGLCKKENYEPIEEIRQKAYEYYCSNLDQIEPREKEYINNLTLLVEFYYYHEKEGLDLQKLLEYVRKFNDRGMYWQYLFFSEKLYEAEESEKKDSKVTISYVNALKKREEYKEAKSVIEKYINRINVVDENSLFLEARRLYSDILWEMGKKEEARQILKEVLEKRKESLRVNDKDTLDSMDHDAIRFGNMGEEEEAKKILKEALERRKEIYEENDPDILKCEFNYAINLWNIVGQGEETEEVVQIMKEVIEKQKERLGENDPATMNSVDIYINMFGNPGEVMEIAEKTLEKQKENLGDNDPETLTSMHFHSMNLWEVGKQEEATQMVKEVIEKRKESLGESDPKTLESMDLYVTYLREMGKGEEARQILKEVIETQTENLGENHTDTLKNINNDKVISRSMLKNEEATQKKKEEFENQKENLGEKHEDTLNSMFKYFESLWEMGKREEATQILKEVIEKRKESLGEDHPDTLTSMFIYSKRLSEMGKQEEATQIKKEILEKPKENLGENHKEFLTIMEKYARSLYCMGEDWESLLIEKEVLDKRKEILGDNDPATLNSAQIYIDHLLSIGWEKDAEDVAEKFNITI